MEQQETNSNEPRLIRNSFQTPDGTVIESRYRHDYVTHTDANGEEYVVDGGLCYVRCSVNDEPAKDLCLYDTELHKVQRDVLTWGTYGKNGDEPFKLKKISEMTTNHIKAVLKECHPCQVRRACMLQELINRGFNDVN